MDSKVMPSVKKPDEVCPKVMEALASAVQEWVLIFFLFIEASFAYLVTKVACYCHLETPCLLCSRLDHTLGKERPEFYLDSICHKHKMKISSLVFCHYHSNLVDVHEMCENCLFSFAAVNKSNAETYRLLVGKMGAGPRIGLDGDSKSCSCCNERSVSGAYAPQMSQTQSTEFQGSGLNLHHPPLFEKGSWLNLHHPPLFENSGVAEHNISRDETYRAGKVSPSSISNFNLMPYVEYEKVKITSDSESETPMSEDEASSFLLKEYCQKHLAEHGLGTSTDDPVLEKFINPARESEPSHMESEVKREVTNTKFTEEAVAVLDHGSEGMNSFVEHKNDASTTPELISFADDPLPPRDIRDVGDLLKETLEVREEAEVETKELKESAENCKVASPSISLSTSEEQSLSASDISDRCLQMPDSLELGDAYKLTANSSRRQLSSKLFEKRSLSGKLLQQRSMSFKESPRDGEDFHFLLSQLSLARGIDLPLTDMSPRFPGNFGEITASDASTSAGIPVLQRRISLERNESSISLDGSLVSEIAGESAIDRLKRQVDHDKKLMDALYKELEEERNAAEIAANQAMAMITRLQEEKAALNMEALQCLRMMDEKVEYEEEGLETARNLLTEKYQVVQDLELKLQLYTKIYGPLSKEEDTIESSTSSHLEELGAKDTNADHVERSTGIFSNPESNQEDPSDSQARGSRDGNDGNQLS